MKLLETYQTAYQITAISLSKLALVQSRLHTWYLGLTIGSLLIMAKLLDDGKNFSDYPEALQHFFTYLATTNLKELIAFTDYYSQSAVGTFSHPVKIIDPVNAKNNAARLYSSADAAMIAEAALDAGDAIDAALAATTKEKTIYYWQKVLGPTFQI